MEYRGSGLGFSVVQPAQVETAMLEGQARPRLLPVVTPDDVASAVLDAVRRDRFEVWVPRSQAIAFKLSAAATRGAREHPARDGDRPDRGGGRPERPPRLPRADVQEIAGRLADHAEDGWTDRDLC